MGEEHAHKLGPLLQYFKRTEKGLGADLLQIALVRGGYPGGGDGGGYVPFNLSRGVVPPPPPVKFEKVQKQKYV